MSFFKKGDWNCACGNHNFAKKTVCYGCGSSRPVNSQTKAIVKPGDWLCPICLTMQFSSRDACRDCGISKDFALDNVKKDSKPKLNKDYFLVLDFEANCSNDNTRDHEIIEFPAVLVNAKDGTTIAEFRSFVKMVNHKKLSAFIKDLTHITDEQVANGLEWIACLVEFEKWCHVNNVTPANTTMVTCGDWDLKTMLKNQLILTKTKLSPFLEELFGCWTNAKVPYVEYTKTKAKGMGGMLEHFGLELTGHHHSGIDDCRNIVKICNELVKLGCDITTPTTVREKKSLLSSLFSKN